jgi:pimeloyl-ACP methyl ester carboxylesterase
LMQSISGGTIAYPSAKKNQEERAGERSQQNQEEEAMARLSVLASLLLSLVIPCNATSAPLAKEAEVNGVRLSYVEEGAGESIVFVHGAFSDLRVWEPVREEVATRYRFIAYTQRYHGLGAWTGDGKEYSTVTHADDLAKFITLLNAGPVHLVGRSGGGAVAMVAALKNPALVRTLTMHEPGALFVLPAESAERKAAREDNAKWASAAREANKAGGPVRTMRLFIEGVLQLEPGGFDRLSEPTQTMFLDNARTAPLMFGAPPAPDITCDALKTFSRPTLVTQGEKTHTFFKLIIESISKCVPGVQQVSFPNLAHGAPSADPAAFTAALFEFLAKRQGL